MKTTEQVEVEGTSGTVGTILGDLFQPALASGSSQMGPSYHIHALGIFCLANYQAPSFMLVT
jgi:hypothetical protein